MSRPLSSHIFEEFTSWKEELWYVWIRFNYFIWKKIFQSSYVKRIHENTRSQLSANDSVILKFRLEIPKFQVL